MPRVAVVVLAYNHWENTTQFCLESLFRAAGATEFEVVAVDNASTDQTRQKLQEWQTRRANLRLVLSDVNLGFPGGNNAGIRAVDAEYYVLLNNDTRVTDHWLDKLVAFADAHPEAGLIGPVSNCVGNEQVLHLAPGTPQEVLAEGCHFARRHAGSFFYTKMLGFFCVLIRKEVFQRIGLLDENFGRGYFEDDDFCLRASWAGFELACLEDVFIYHQGGASFNEISTTELFLRNRRYYEEKHRLKVRSSFRVGVFLNLLEQYAQNSRPETMQALRESLASRVKTMRSFDNEWHDVEAREAVHAAQAACQAKEEELQSAREKLQWQQEQLQERLHFVEALHREREMLQSELQDWRSNSQELQREVRASQQTLRIRRRKIEKLRQTLHAQLDENVRHCGVVEHLQGEVGALREQLQAMHQSLRWQMCLKLEKLPGARFGRWLLKKLFRRRSSAA